MRMSKLKAEQFLSRFLERIDGDRGCPSTVINGHGPTVVSFPIALVHLILSYSSPLTFFLLYVVHLNNVDFTGN